MTRKSNIFLILLMLVAVPLFSQSLEQQQKKREQLEHDIAILRSQLNATSNRSEQAINALNLISAQKVSRQKLISRIDDRIAGYDISMRKVQKEINRQQKVLDTLQAHYSRLILGAYKNRDVKIWYMYALSSESVSQAFRRFGYFKGLSAQISRQANDIIKAQNELNAKKTELLNLKSRAQKEKSARQTELDKLKLDEDQQKRLIDNLKKNTHMYKASLNEKQREMKTLNREIAKMLEAVSGKGAKKSGIKVDMVLNKKFEKNKGKLPWPVDGPVVEHFGAYMNRQLSLSMNSKGINIACDPSEPVKSVFDGKVVNIMLTPGYGQCILVQHGSYFTTYCKVKNVTVHPGEDVKTGQIMGEVSTIMGKTQLYFQVWKKDYVDPELWLRDR